MDAANIRPIETEADYERAAREIERHFDAEPEPGTPEAARFDVLASPIEHYEDRVWPIRVGEVEPGADTSSGDESVASSAEGPAISRGEVPPARLHVPPLMVGQNEAARDPRHRVPPPGGVRAAGPFGAAGGARGRPACRPRSGPRRRARRRWARGAA